LLIYIREDGGLNLVFLEPSINDFVFIAPAFMEALSGI
jgi:hypothetical protein